MSAKHNQLIRARVTITTEIVVENYYGDDPVDAAKSAWDTHKQAIIDQVQESVMTDVSEVKSLDELPKGWDERCLPWLPSIAFGSSKQEKKIGEFFGKSNAPVS